MYKPYPIIQINNCQIIQSPYPEGGNELSPEITKMKQDGIDLWVNLLQEHELYQLGLQNFQEKARAHDIQALHFPIRNGLASTFDKYVNFINLLYPMTQESKGMLIHCRHGIGRSSLTTIGLLLKDGYSLKDASDLVSKRRGFNVPSSPSQKKILLKYAELIEK